MVIANYLVSVIMCATLCNWDIQHHIKQAIVPVHFQLLTPVVCLVGVDAVQPGESKKYLTVSGKSYTYVAS